MLEAHSLITGQTPAATLTLELTFDDRQKSRHRSQTVCGQALGWFIERGHVLKDGDLLQCTTGEVAVVVAAPESVSTVYAKTSLELTRAAYHLGNRHVPIELKPDHLKIEPDHVLAEMLRAMHLIVNEISAPFEPESGAYGDHGHAH